MSLPGSTGQSSNPRAIDAFEAVPRSQSGGYWIARSSRAMTVTVIDNETNVPMQLFLVFQSPV
jgi:hypothetical protein